MGTYWEESEQRLRAREAIVNALRPLVPSGSDLEAVVECIDALIELRCYQLRCDIESAARQAEYDRSLRE